MKRGRKGESTTFGACLQGAHGECPGDGCACTCHLIKAPKILTVDAHVDLLWILSGFALQKAPTITHRRMQFGGLDRVTLALYIAQHWQDQLGEAKTWAAIEKQLKIAQNQLPDQFIALEGGACLGRDPIQLMIRLKQLIDAKIKYFTLCHNENNLLCGSSSDAHASEMGLTRLGREVIDDLEDANVLVDVSHASDKTLEDVLYYATHPLIASHSGCREMLDNVRNLSDTQIKHIASFGGMVCIPFARRMVRTLEGVAEHVDHVCQVTGTVLRVGIGSDLDGAVMVEGVAGPENWSDVVIDQLDRWNYTDEQILQIAGGNLLRLYGE